MTDAPQRSKEWYEARLGKVGASEVKDVIATGLARENLLWNKVTERQSGMPADNYVSFDMAKGIEMEPEARAAYSFFTDRKIIEVGWVPHPTILMAGASPDGFIDDDGLIEIKCPKRNTHGKTLLSKKVDVRYAAQIQWQLACTGRKWCDWVSYNASFKPRMRMFIKRVYRNEDAIKGLTQEVIKFLDEVNQTMDALEKEYEEQRAA